MYSAKKILIADRSAEFGAICQKVLTQKGYEVILRERDGLDVLSAIQSESPDLVIMNALMIRADAAFVLQQFQDTGSPLFIITSAFYNPLLEQELARRANCCYMLEPFKLEELYSRVDLMLGYDIPFAGTMRRGFVSDHELEILITQILRELGVPPHIKGYRYLRESILQLILDINIIHSVTKTLYPMIAKKFDTTPVRVERSIRHAIELAWEQGNIDTLNYYFGYSSRGGRGKPSNSEFVAAIADRIQIQMQRPPETSAAVRSSENPGA